MANTALQTKSTRRVPSSAPRYTVIGPMNIVAALNAVPIHAPSSTPMPMWPRRSARPSERKRAASVAIAAPKLTARMPSSGVWERSAGSADARARVPAGSVTEPVAARRALDMRSSVGALTASFAGLRPPTIPIAAASISVESSSAILTGTRCTTFVKLPVALSGGRSANCDPLAGAISSTRPCITSPGYASMRTSAGSPTLMFVSCVSRKFAWTHEVPPDKRHDLRAR